MASSTADTALVELAFGDGELAPPVLERLFAAAATRAELPVDRIVNAHAALDALATASKTVFAGEARRLFSISIAPGEVRISVDGLESAQAGQLIDAATLPEVGGVLERMASSVATEQNGSGTSLVLAFS